MVARGSVTFPAEAFYSIALLSNKLRAQNDHDAAGGNRLAGRVAC